MKKQAFLWGILLSFILSIPVFAAQHDYDIANGPGATVRADINDAYEAVATNNSGATAPSTTYANMWWFDTSTNLLKQRNNANTDWVTVALKDGNGWTPYRQGTAIGDVSTLTKDTDGALTANSDTKVATQKATKTYADLKIPLTYIDTDEELTANSDSKVPSQKAIKAYVDTEISSIELFSPYANGTTYIEAANDTERSTLSTTYVKLKEFSPVFRGGSVTVAWQHKIEEAVRTAYSKVYINDIAVGAEKSTSSEAYVDVSESGLSVTPGDVIQIYVKSSNDTRNAYVQNVKIKCTNPIPLQAVSGY